MAITTSNSTSVKPRICVLMIRSPERNNLDSFLFGPALFNIERKMILPICRDFNRPVRVEFSGNPLWGGGRQARLARPRLVSHEWRSRIWRTELHEVGSRWQPFLLRNVEFPICNHRTRRHQLF